MSCCGCNTCKVNLVSALGSSSIAANDKNDLSVGGLNEVGVFGGDHVALELEGGEVAFLLGEVLRQHSPFLDDLGVAGGLAIRFLHALVR